MQAGTKRNACSTKSSCPLLSVAHRNWGNSPCLIAGDLNTTLEASEVLQRATSSGGYADFAASMGTVLPTCFQRASSPGIRIDFILGNSVATATLRDFRVVTDSALPTHRPWQCDLDMRSAHQTGVRFRRPTNFDLSWGRPPLRQRLQLHPRLLLPSIQDQNTYGRHASPPMTWKLLFR